MADQWEDERKDFETWLQANAPGADRAARQLAWRAWTAALGAKNATPKAPAKAPAKAKKKSSKKASKAKKPSEVDTQPGD